MKKTFRRFLFVLAIVAVMMSFAAVSAFAADDCLHENTYRVTVDPTCTEQGYDLVVCIDCGTTMKTNLTEPIGHDYGERTYTAVKDLDGNVLYYQMTRVCGQKYRVPVYEGGEIKMSDGNAVYEEKACANIYSCGDNYYKVTYINPCVSAATDESITYTSVTTAVKAEELSASKRAYAEYENDNADVNPDPVREYVAEGDSYVLYVKEGCNAVYAGDAPFRSKDKNYGSYTFAGWAETGTVDTVAVNDITTDTQAIAISGNTTFYAQFKGNAEYYVVKFINYNGATLSSGISTAHGLSVTYDAANPTRETDVKNSYTFAGWAYNGVKVDTSKIYGNVALTAVFDTTANEYTVVCLDANKSKTLSTDEGVTYGASAVNGLNILPADLAKASDEVYNYSHSGNWTFAESPGFTTTLSQVMIPDYYYNADGDYVKTTGGETFTLIPNYNKQKITYLINMYVVNTDFEEADKEDYSLAGFKIQVKDAAGQLVASGETNAQGYFLCKVSYSTSFTVTAVSSDNKYSIVQAMASPSYYDQSGENYVIRPSLDSGWVKDHQNNCSCICHNTLLKPLWVRILNLLYRIFNIKYVCCDDMYATLGALLAYAQ